MQAGVVHREQLIAAGIARSGIAHRLRTGRLYPDPLHRDVYLVGRPRSERWGPATAAALHFRGRAVLSHSTSAASWGLVEQAEGVAVTVVGCDPRSRPGLRVHRATAIHRDDLRRRYGLPVTSPARALLELAAQADALALEGALAACRRLRLASDAEIVATIDRAPRHAGAGKLRRLVTEGGAALTRSEAERVMLSLIRAAQLPRPLANVELEGVEVDFVWPGQRLVLEIDGFAFHGDRLAFERDRRRDQRLAAAGYRVMRITWRQLRDEPYAVIARVAAALAGR